MARRAVRGLSWSSFASSRRFADIATVRAVTMHRTISRSWPIPGLPPAARKVLSSANGSAKTVCESLMSCAKTVSRFDALGVAAGLIVAVVIARALRHRARRANVLRVPAGVEDVLHADEVEQFPRDEVDDLTDGRRVEIETRVRRSENHAGFAEDLVVVHVDRRQRHLAVNQHELAPLLQRHRGGAGDQVVAQAVCDLGERVAGAG